MFLFKGNMNEDIMKLLSRTEEFILLAVLFLKENAYAVRIRKQLKKVTGKTWSYGALFTSLEQMVRKGYLESYLTEPLSKRGGRRKRIYQITDTGKDALYEINRLEKIMWETAFEE
jgi:PadR family transcriptional regulator PadR